METIISAITYLYEIIRNIYIVIGYCFFAFIPLFILILMCVESYRFIVKSIRKFVNKRRINALEKENKQNGDI